MFSVELRIDNEPLFLEDNRLEVVEILESDVLGIEWTDEKLKLLLVSSVDCSHCKKIFLNLEKPSLLNKYVEIGKFIGAK